MTDETTEREGERGWLGFGPKNLAIFGLAVVVIAVGYFLLDRGSITVAPILLVLGYVVLIPVGLVLGYRDLEDV